MFEHSSAGAGVSECSNVQVNREEAPFKKKANTLLRSFISLLSSTPTPHPFQHVISFLAAAFFLQINHTHSRDPVASRPPLCWNPFYTSSSLRKLAYAIRHGCCTTSTTWQAYSCRSNSGLPAAPPSKPNCPYANLPSPTAY